MREYKVTGKLTNADVDKINSLGTDVLVVLNNTKNQEASIIGKFKDNIKIRIIGGLDEKAKPKFDTREYYNRTIYTPLEVVGIITEFEKIEKAIKPNWIDLEKALYMYDNLATNIIYEQNESYRDEIRTLNVMNSKKAVCSGFALTYKEAMDRLDIECEYINKPHCHSWNAIKINGEYYNVDLTWEANLRQKGNKDALFYFACDPSFSENIHHKADSSDMQVPSRCLPIDEIVNAYYKVKYEDEKKLDWKLVREDKTSCCLSKIATTTKGLFVYAHSEIDSDNKLGDVNVIYSELDLNKVRKLSKEQKSHIKNKLLSKERIDLKLKETNGYVGTSELRNNLYCQVCYQNIKTPLQSTYNREDNTSFVIIPTKSKNKNEVNAYRLIEFVKDENDEFVCQNNIIYSENDLLKDQNPVLKKEIANVLLSKDRVKQKIKDDEGYVGYFKQQGDNHIKCYDPIKKKEIEDYTC